jgi:branched-chain amino acid transport system ATP-binding protein
MTRPLLLLDGVTVRISALNILRGVNLEVAHGSIIGIAGRNGAGKTTTLRAIMGLVPGAGGRMELDGVQLDNMPAFRRARAGIGYLPEDRRLIGTLSVHDNLLVPAQACGDAAADERLRQVLELMPELRELGKRPGASLSGGQQKLVALARSFVIGSRLLLLDEPFEGVSTALSRRLAGVVREFVRLRAGLSVLVAESDLKRVAMLAERAYVIERGEITGQQAI